MFNSCIALRWKRESNGADKSCSGLTFCSNKTYSLFPVTAFQSHFVPVSCSSLMMPYIFPYLGLYLFLPQYSTSRLRGHSDHYILSILQQLAQRALWRKLSWVLFSVLSKDLLLLLFCLPVSNYYAPPCLIVIFLYVLYPRVSIKLLAINNSES